MGSKQSVSLVYDDEVMAMVGWLDGRNGHLAEQVAAKSHLIYLETRATDPTLSQAYVPWFFRLVPSDDQQARTLLELIRKEGGGRLAILTREDYDTRYAVQSLIKEAAIHVGNAPLLLPVPPEGCDQEEILGQLQNEEIKHLVVPVFSPAVYELLLRGSKEIPALGIYGTLAFTTGLENSTLDPGSLPGLKRIHTYRGGELVPGSSLSSSYVRDGMLVLITAIEEAGGDRALLKTYLTNLTGFRGSTGPVSFDEMGNRTGDLQILELP
jgi:ABC-type branched-subunit amino acid transport system substrate-binding protein